MNSKSRKIITAILMMSVVQMGTVVISSILANVARAFPSAEDATVQFLMTFPSLAVMVSSVASAPIAGRVPKKYISSLGCFLFALSGVLSWLIHSSLAVLFVWAGMMGIGVGFVCPVATSLVADCFRKEQQPMFMGWQSSAANAGGMLMTFIGGWLAGGHWSLTYLVYLIALPGAIVTLLWVPKNTVREKVMTQTEEQSENGNIFRAFIKPGILNAFIVTFIGTMLYNNVPANISMVIEEKGMGGAAQSGVASAILLLASALSGIVFGKLSKKTGKYVVVLGLGAILAGQTIIALADSLPILYIGCFIGGTALSLIMPQKTFEATLVRGVKSEVATMIALAGSYLGAFSTPLITRLATDIFLSGNVVPRLFLSAAMAGIAGIVLAILIFVGENKAKRQIDE